MGAGGSDIDETSPLEQKGESPRSLTGVLLRISIFVVLTVSLTIGSVQFFLDVQKEIDQIKRTAEHQLDGLLPAMEKTVWELDEKGAESVIVGLFKHPAIRKVSIEAGNNIFALSMERDLAPGLSFVPPMIETIEMELSQPAGETQLGSYRQSMGHVRVEVDTSKFSPSFIVRKGVFFLILLLQNALICGCLFYFMFGGLTRYVLQMSTALSKWQPRSNMEELPTPPKLFQDSEIDHLGRQVKKLMQIASRELISLRSSHSKINDLNAALKSKSDSLSQALKKQNSELERANQKLFELATRDKLTDAFNRRHFDEEANRIWREAANSRGNFAVLICDIDHFKKYNDFYGHLRGDMCLRKVSKAMQEVCAESDCLFARYGGEEFVVFIPDNNYSSRLAENLVTAIASLELEHAQSPVAPYVTLSVGLAENKYVQAHSIEELIEAADLALYRAKEKGRNRHEVTTLELMQVATLDSDLEFEIENAINLELFQPFFQPQVDMRTGEIVSVEVLARMPTFNGSLSLPREFMTKAEALGDTNRIDMVIQRNALEMLADWSKRGFAPQRMSFNLSENTLLTGMVPSLLSEFPKELSHSVSFEIPEVVILETNSTVFHKRLQDITDHGVTVEIDQFGVGLSSICALADIAPQRIKISRDLISMIGMQPEGRKVVRAVVEIANAFDIEVTAVGVETEYQSKFLLELGVNRQQGYLISHPLQRNKIEALLIHNSQHYSTLGKQIA